MDYTMDTHNPASSVPAQFSFMGENVLKCPECPPEAGDEIVDDFRTGDWICTGCGMVLDRVVDDGAEWRTFANEDGTDGPDRSRVGGHGGDEFATFIGGNPKTSSLARAEKRGREANKNSMAVQRGNARIDEFCEQHGLSTAIKDQAYHIYKLAQTEHQFRGRVKQEAMLGPIIFIACRTLKQPRTFNEVQAMTQQSKKVMYATVNKLVALLRKKEPQKAEKGSSTSASTSTSTSTSASTSASAAVEKEGPSPIPDTTTGGPRPDTKVGRIKEPLARFVASMNFRNAFVVETIAIRMAEKAEIISTPFDGRTPTLLAAAYICFASWLVGEPRTMKDIALGCKVGLGTLKTILKSFVQMQDQLVDKSWKAVDVSRVKDLMAC
ncbi:uncharacterized protein PG986_001316 [Apiospora aurea]|uniref:General transcription factor TFIIB n=1 Tax=Apiospora aurea TaxID=335848 RepID=A0ABR1QWL4_9PEZI